MFYQFPSATEPLKKIFAKNKLILRIAKGFGVKLLIMLFATTKKTAIAIPNAEKTITVDVSSLMSGTYFIRFDSEAGNMSRTFVKKE